MKKTIETLLIVIAQLVGIISTFIVIDSYTHDGKADYAIVLLLAFSIVTQFAILAKIYLFKDDKYISKKEILLYARKHRYSGLCVSIDIAVKHFGLKRDVKDIFPLFQRENAFKFGADIDDLYWWKQGVWNTGRDEFLSWLIEQYKDEYIRV